MARSTPYKLVLAFRAPNGRRAALDAWLHELLATAGGEDALQGSTVLTEGDRSLLLLRFATQEHCASWRDTPAVREIMARGAEFAAETPPIERTGFETWFALPGSPAAAAAPPKWKMALVTWCSLLPQIVALKFVVPKSLPFLVGVAVSTAIPVCVLTWVAMPTLTRALHRWLYPTDVRR